MIFKTQFSPAATIDLEKIIEYHFARNPETAKRYYSNIMDNIRKLPDFPKQGRIVPEFEDIFTDKYRELIYENFRIIYKLEKKTITIIRIVDSRRLLDTECL